MSAYSLRVVYIFIYKRKLCGVMHTARQTVARQEWRMSDGRREELKSAFTDNITNRNSERKTKPSAPTTEATE